MLTRQAHTTGILGITVSKAKDYAQFVKLRLSSLVVFSAFIGYLIAIGSAPIDWMKLLALVVGGFLVTGASNGFNQLIEKDLDKLMDRTSSRPIPAGKMTVYEGIIAATLMGLAGTLILWYFLNPLSGLLGMLALLMYVALYTPMKRVSPFAVFVGAFPGAIPPMLGYVAETGSFGLLAGLLFLVQFIWQFPHFWAIAWKLDGDYQKAGFRLLPSKGGKNRSTAFQILIYTLFLIPISYAPIFFGIAGPVAAVIIIASGLWFFSTALRLFISCEEKDASRLMFASFIYLPVVQVAYLIQIF